MQTNLSEHPQALLADYVMGLLEEDELYVVEKHVLSCERCQKELNDLDSVMVAWTDELPQEQASEQTWQSLQARIAADKAAEQLNRDVTNNLDKKMEALETDVLPDIASSISYEDTALSEIEVPVTQLPLGTRFLPWIIAASFFVLAIGGGFWGESNQRVAAEARANQALLSSYLGQPSVQKIALFNETDVSIGAILVSEQAALFVLSENAPNQKTYQAWGHTSDDWTPDSSELLTSLGVSSGNLIEIQTAGFASIYLSLEPRGGSPQPTQPLTSVSLAASKNPNIIEILSPVDRAIVTSPTSIVRGELGNAVRSLSYKLNGAEEIETSFSNRRFAFTVTGLIAGENSLELRVTLADGSNMTKRLSLIYQP